MLLRRGLLVHPEELDEIWLDEIGKTNLNVLGLHPVGGKNAARTLEAAIARHQSPDFQRLIARAKGLGLTVEYEAHALTHLLPRELFAAHPEYFRMDEHGERVPDANLCPSSAEALALVGENAEKLTKALDAGSARRFWWPDDVSGKLCHCPLCRALNGGDQLLRITNAIHRGVRRADPQARTAYLAYHDGLTLPRLTEPEDGLFLEYAPIGRNHHRAICDAACPENAAQTATLQPLLSFFGRSDAQVLDYWMDNSLFSNWTKPPRRFSLDADVMARDVEFYEGLGFESITSFACYLGADYRALYGLPPAADYARILDGNM